MNSHIAVQDYFCPFGSTTELIIFLSLAGDATLQWLLIGACLVLSGS